MNEMSRAEALTAVEAAMVKIRKRLDARLTVLEKRQARRRQLQKVMATIGAIHERIDKIERLHGIEPRHNGKWDGVL